MERRFLVGFGTLFSLRCGHGGGRIVIVFEVDDLQEMELFGSLQETILAR